MSDRMQQPVTRPTASRYLYPEDKAELVKWFAYVRDPERLKDGWGGDPDEDMMPLCDFINGFDGIMTLSSCSGHKEHSKPGHLMFKMSEAVTGRFDKIALELARDTHIRNVHKSYMRDGQEWVTVNFWGNDSDCLPATLAVLRGFFVKLLGGDS